MMRLPDAWTWDFWLADDGATYHLYVLKALRSLGDPDLRHWNVTIGHAVSHDLVSWTEVGDALAVGPAPSFDDLTTWTGSVVRDGDVWRMFYTGTSQAERGQKQRIGMAVSTDLHTWTKHGARSVLESDGRWYEDIDETQWHDEAWRDPWVFADPAGDGWHMLITARANSGAADDRGVIGHAWSPDLIDWESRPPLSAPGCGFGHLEVPQVEVVDGHPVLIFSCLDEHVAARRRGQGGGVWCVPAADVRGPFDVERAELITDETLYSGRLARDRDGRWVLLAFHNLTTTGDGRREFVGELSDPMPVTWNADRSSLVVHSAGKST